MELLTELLQIQDQHSEVIALLEHLGTLNQINKQLRDMLMHRPYSSGSPKRGEKLESGEIGRDSQVEMSERIVSFKKLWDDVSDKKSYATVLVLDGKQVAIMVKQDPRSYRDRTSFMMVALKDAFAILDDAFAAKITKDYKMPGAWKRDVSEVNAKRFLKQVFDGAAKSDVEIKLMCIMPDKERSSKKASRASTREGRVVIPTEDADKYSNKYGHYLDLLRKDLRARLDKYKSSKALKATSPEEMIKLMKKKGILAKIEFVGQVYDYANDRIEMTSLAGHRPERHRSESYIQYRLNHSSPQYKKYQQEIKPILDQMAAESDEKRKGLSKEEADKVWDEYYNKRKKLAPPRELKVILGMKGGVIFPEKVVISESDFF